MTIKGIKASWQLAVISWQSKAQNQKLKTTLLKMKLSSTALFLF
jgi:hypothetical protein